MTTLRRFNTRRVLWTGALLGMLLLAAQPARAQHLLVDGLQWLAGSTIGPGGALFVTEPATGRVLRVDPQSGETTVFASGLPQPVLPVMVGGAMDVAFIGSTAYVLVTFVGPDVGGTDTVGIYRVDGPTSFTVVADLGAFNIANPPVDDFDVAFESGVLYAIEPYRGGFLVTDGHLNRILLVRPNGAISVFRSFSNIVPTGLALQGDTVYMAEAGPAPHLPVDGRVIAFNTRSPHDVTVAAGGPLMVDVEFGRGGTLFALAQGTWDTAFEGSPAFPNTGFLLRVNGDGSLTPLVGNLDRPTSMEFIGNTAYVTTLGGQVWRFDDVASPPFGRVR